MNGIRASYFQWICRLVQANRKMEGLLYLLDGISFTYLIPMDGNRYDDGIELRYRFGYEMHIPQGAIATEIDDHPCSVLEMMVALCLRIEEQIMDDPDKGSRLHIWFRRMLENLGLYGTVVITDEGVVNRNIDRFLQRKYRSNGFGNIFYIPDVQADMRDVEIWDQAMWYIDYYISKERAYGY